jgi:hypothetical protein
MTSNQIDLHELANNNRFGRAETILQEAGYWDENGGKDAKAFRVRVDVQFLEDDTEYVTVNARTEDEAFDLAEKHFAGDPDYLSAEAISAELQSAE